MFVIDSGKVKEVIYLFVVQYCSSHHYIICIILKCITEFSKTSENLKGKENVEIRKLRVLCTYQCKSRGGGGGGGSAGKGRGFDAWDYPRCRAFDRAKRPRGRDI